MKFLMFSGSLRTESLNRKLIAVARDLIITLPDSEVVVADLKVLNFPVYDGDIEAKGLPESVDKLGRMILDCDALIISSPEYNASIAGSLKNTIDWVSRLKPVPFEKKPILLLGASPGALGSIRALNASRAPFETLGAYVHPGSYGLARAHEAFTADNKLVDTAVSERLLTLFKNFSIYADALNKSSRS